MTTIRKLRDNVWLHVFLIVFFAISLRIIAAYFIGHHFKPRLWEYENLTQSLLKDGTYSMQYREYGEYKALLAPGYSFLTYAIYMIFGTSHVLMLFIQFFLMTAFCLIIYGLTYFLFKNRMIALLAGLLAAVHPGLVYYSSAMLHQLTLYLPLFYASIFILCLCYSTGKLKYFIFLGLVGGYAVLTRATILPVIGLSLIILIIFQRKANLKKRLLFSGIAFLLLLTVNLPWCIRNYLTFDRVIFSQTNKWEAFWVGNNPEATGGHFRIDGTIVLQHKPPKMQKEINAARNNELKIESIFKKYAFDYIKEQPVDYVNGVFRKAFYFWWFYPHTGIMYPKIYLIGYKIIYSMLLLLTISGLIICYLKKLWKFEMIFPLILLLGIWGAHTMNFMEMRHRWTVEPIMLIFASVAIYFWGAKIYNKFFQTTKHNKS